MPKSAPVGGFRRRALEALFVLIIAFAAYLLISLVSFSPHDSGWSYSSGQRDDPINAGGPAGAWFASVFFSLFGLLAFLIPVMVVWSGWLFLKERTPEDSINMPLIGLRWSGFLLVLMSGCALATLHLGDFGMQLPEGPGGILGEWLEVLLVGMFSGTGATLILIASLLAGLTVFTGVSWLTVMDLIGGWTLAGLARIGAVFDRVRERRDEKNEARKHKQERSVALAEELKKAETRVLPRIEPKVRKVEPSVRVEKEKQTKLFIGDVSGELPPLALLDPAKPSAQQYSEESLNAMSRLVEMKLADFGVEVQVIEVHPGPVITLFELDLAAGTKASKVSGLSRDLARAISTISCGWSRTFPARPLSDWRFPTRFAISVYLSEVLQSEVYDHSKSSADAYPGQGHRRQPDRGRSCPYAAFAGGRHHRVRQIGGHQRHGAEPAVQGDGRTRSA